MKRASRGAALLLVIALAGCSLVRFYEEQTEGISPVKLVPLYFQEQRYAADRTLEAKVRGALLAAPHLRGADIGVDVYHGVVTLRGAAVTPAAVAVARSVFGVESVERAAR